jgi:HD superfamily phosphohydrolase
LFQERWQANEKILAPLEQQLQETPEVNRLHGLFQLGGKVVPDLRSHEYVNSPAFHTRFNHSELLAAIIKATGAHINVPAHQLKPSVAAAWLHDTGHPAFSHLSDRLLVAHGMPEHEERSIEYLQTRPEIKKTLKIFETNPEEVADLIKERGALGTLQSVSDTLSYLIMDSGMAKRNIFFDGGLQYVKDIQGINPDKGLLIIKTPELWQSLLEFRAMMMKDIYLHPLNKIAEEALRQLMRLALEENLITLDEIAEQTDMYIRLRLQSHIQHDPGAAKMSGRSDKAPQLEDYKGLYDLTMGFDQESWDHRLYDTRAEAEDFLYSKYRFTPEVIKQSLIVNPIDYTAKTLTFLIETPQGLQEQTFQARDTKLRETDKKYMVYTPR